MLSNMAEKTTSIRIKNRLANFLHILFNIVVAVGAWGLVWMFPDTPWPAIALVALSKYRVFMVKPRYWIPNILSGLVDFVFGIGVVLLIWVMHGWGFSVGALIAQIVLVIIYALWLLWLKPNNKEWAVMAQAGISQFIGLAALFTVANYLWLPIVILFAFFIGFACSRHMLMIHKEPQHDLLAMAWGLAVSELAFLGYHWSVIYGFGIVQIPEVAVIITIISIIIEKFYRSARRNDGAIKQEDVLLPTLFGAILITVILIFFSGLL